MPIKIGVVGRLDPKKGQDIALKALAEKFKLSKQTWELNFYGDDTPGETKTRPYLEKLANELGVKDHVHFHGHQDHIENRLREIDVLWMPSYKETFGRVLIEAMASGVPVVASAAGGVPDIITPKKNGILFETKNPTDLALKTLDNLMLQVRSQARKDIELKYDQTKIWPEVLKTIAP